MIDYCIRDVELTERLYITLQPEVKQISRECIDLEYRVRHLVSTQERNGFALDMQKAMCLVARLKDKSDSIENDVTKMFPPLPTHTRDVKIKIKKDGTLSSVGLRHIEDKSIVAGDHSAIEYQEFNLSSRQQIVKRLLLRGWQPQKFTDKGHPIVDEGVLKDVDLPEAQKIAEFLMLRKRIAQVQSWIDAVKDDGKVHGQVLTLRAISGRMAHHSPNMAQVPASYSPYGKECRECWTTTSPDYSLVGCDASSLELRALAHYLNDPKFTSEVVDGDIHTANQEAAPIEIVTGKQVR
jgi:DNA polymerase-1